MCCHYLRVWSTNNIINETPWSTSVETEQTPWGTNGVTKFMEHIWFNREKKKKRCQSTSGVTEETHWGRNGQTQYTPPKARNVDFEETDSAAHWGQTPRFLHRKKSKKISCMVYFLSSFPKYC